MTVRKLRDAESNTELDCEINELRPTLTMAADLIEQLQIELGDAGTICYGCHLNSENTKLQSQLTESQRREKENAELIRKIYFATDKDLCDCCRKIVRMIEIWWGDDEKGSNNGN